MKLLLERFHFLPDRTIGTLKIGDATFFTLEDKDRQLESGGVKVYGETAIPRGTYKVVVSYSGRFKRELPAVLDVPGFTGIRIHSGNRPEDSEGCILIGKGLSEDMTELRQSRVALQELMLILDAAYDLGKELELEIV